MTHADLVKVAARWLRNTRRCGVVLTEHCGGTHEIPDAIGWRGGFLSIQVECKVSVADFRADQRKHGRGRPECAQAMERWYLTPAGLLATSALPAGWGLLEADGSRVRTVRPADRAVIADALAQHEITRLYMELRRYQAQGIRYKTIAELQAEDVQAPTGGQ